MNSSTKYVQIIYLQIKNVIRTLSVVNEIQKNPTNTSLLENNTSKYSQSINFFSFFVNGIFHVHKHVNKYQGSAKDEYCPNPVSRHLHAPFL